MDASKINRFVGLPYDEAALDCADLAVMVQRELFGRNVELPGRRQRMAAPQASIQRYSGELATPVSRDALQDGDVVIFKGETLHIGTIFFLDGAPWVLHADAAVGFSLLQPLSDIACRGLFVEGFYRWK